MTAVPSPLPEPRDRWEGIYSGFFRPVGAWFRGDASHRRAAAIERLLALPADELARQRLEALRALLVHARDTVPWHRERMAKAGFVPENLRALEGLAALPP